HPDFIVISPKKEGSAYTVEHPEILSWLKTSDFRPLEFNYRVVVIEEAYLLSSTIQNKWLKRLEEPTTDTVVFMLRSRPNPLLPTIESRALKLSLPRPTTQALSLRSHLSASPDLLSALAQIASLAPAAIWPNAKESSLLVECLKQKRWHVLSE